MSFLSVLALAGMAAPQGPEPVLWLRTDGLTTVQGRRIQPHRSPGTQLVRTQYGFAYDFDGRRSGLLIDDLPALRLTQSITVSVWVNLRSYVNDGPGAQLLFRGDDRCGHDPYALVVHSNGTINFGVQTAEDKGMGVSAELPLFRWSHVLASIDGDTGQLKMWLNGDLIATGRTSFRAFANLESGAAPGLGIGNVQNEKGPHNQPINGQLADLRLYDRALTPDDLGIRWFFPNDPPVLK